MKRITLITGHYGSGKTNFAVNLALRQAAEGKKVTVVDLDIVNPYFRTAEFAEKYFRQGLKRHSSGENALCQYQSGYSGDFL